MDTPMAKRPKVARYSPKQPQSNATPNGQNKLVSREFRFLFVVYDYVYVYQKRLPSTFRYPLCQSQS